MTKHVDIAPLVIDFVRRKFPKVKIEHILVSNFLGGEHKAVKVIELFMICNPR